MESVTSISEITGNKLIEAVVNLTGLPMNVIQHELHHYIEKSGHEIGTLTLDDLRAVMLHYLESTHDEISSE